MLIKYKLRNNPTIRTIAVLLACLFFLNNIPFVGDSHALAPAPGTQNPAVRREAEMLDYLLRGRLIFAEAPEDERFLKELNHADAILLSHGKILAAKELKNDPLALIRKIIHEEVEAIMQIMEREDRARYSGLINMLLSDKAVMEAYQTLPGNTDLPVELLANHMIATAFELLILKSCSLAEDSEFTPRESDFLRAIEPMVNASKHNYFTGVFWDPVIRETKIRVAMANGIKFYQAASHRPRMSRGVFGARLKLMRQTYEVSQTAIAESVGCTQAVISLIETGRMEPNDKLKEKIAGFFDDSVDSFMERDPLLPEPEALVADREKSFFGRRLKFFRNGYDVRQREIADWAGCSQSMISFIENGRVEPDVQMKDRLAAFFDEGLESFMNNDPEFPKRGQQAYPLVSKAPKPVSHFEDYEPHDLTPDRGPAANYAIIQEMLKDKIALSKELKEFVEANSIPPASLDKLLQALLKEDNWALAVLLVRRARSSELEGSILNVESRNALEAAEETLRAVGLGRLVSKDEIEKFSKTKKMPHGSPWHIFNLLSARFAGRAVSVEDIRVNTEGKMPDGHLSYETVERDLAVLLSLNVVIKIDKDTPAKYKALEPVPLVLDGILTALGDRPSSEEILRASAELAEARVASSVIPNKKEVMPITAIAEPVIPETETFAFQAALWRIRKGWKQSDAALRLGKSTGYISAIETGSFVPSPEIQADIAAMYQRYGIATNLKPQMTARAMQKQAKLEADESGAGSIRNESGIRGFADLLREARKKKRMTQAELASHIGMTQVSISQWEAGKSEPTDLVKTRIASALNLKPEELDPPDAGAGYIRPAEADLVKAGPNAAAVHIDPEASHNTEDDRAPSQFAARMREARKRAGLTQVDLAANLNMTQGSISQWESGRIEPSEDVKRRIAAALGISFEELARVRITETHGDGYIRQGSQAYKIFESKLDEIRKNDLRKRYGPRIAAILGDFLKSSGKYLNGNKEALEALRIRIGGMAIYEFYSVVQDRSDFVLGYANLDKGEIFVARDLMAKLDSLKPATLADEYLLHEILCPVLGHYPAIKAAQAYFRSANYPKSSYLAYQTDEKPYKGLLGKALRGFIDRGADRILEDTKKRILTETDRRFSGKGDGMFIDAAMADKFDAALADLQDFMEIITGPKVLVPDPVKVAIRNNEAFSNMIKALGDLRRAEENKRKLPDTILGDIKWLRDNSEASAKVFQAISREALHANVKLHTDASAIQKKFEHMSELCASILSRTGSSAILTGKANVFGGGKFDPGHELVNKGMIIGVSDYKNIDGMDLVAYAKKMRDQHGVGRLYFDLDLTVFRSMGYLSSSKWFEHVLKEFGPEKTLNWWGNMGHEARQIKNGFFYRLMDADMPGIIAELRREGFEVIGLTARAPDKDTNRTNEILARLGVSMDEVIFTSGAGKKGEELDRFETNKDGRPGAVRSIFIEDSFKNLELVIKDRDHVYGIHYNPPNANYEDDLDYKEYIKKAEASASEGNTGNSFEYYFNAVVKILELKDVKREDAYKVLAYIHEKLSAMSSPKPEGYEKLLQIAEIAKDGRSYLFHDDQARKLRSKLATAPGIPATAFTSAIEELRGVSYEEFGERAVTFTGKAGELDRSGQSLILYADDILGSGLVADLESTVKNILSKNNILTGGKIVLYTKKSVNAAILEDLIKKAGAGIDTLIINAKDINTPDGESKEVEALLRYARAKGAGDILGLIKGPVSEPEELSSFARSAKLPVIIVGPEKGIYSFAQALSMVIDAKLNNGAISGWLMMLPPIKAITEETKAQYESYQRSLAALVAA